MVQERLRLGERCRTRNVPVPEPRTVSAPILRRQCARLPSWFPTVALAISGSGSEMTEEEIAQHWAFNGKVASARGTLLHYHCEAHLNGRHVAAPRSQEFEQFLLLEAVLAETGYHAFRTEVWSR